ncbi:MAG TPA: amidohydrolase family protein [Acidimicrobiales bacterium]|nr:amidohydrolase family protein [Acidimicrobiales bacterium]
MSADAHVLEPPHIWERWLPTAFREKAPKLAKDAAGGDGWIFAGSVEPDPIGLTATPGMPWDQFRWTGVTYDEARPGCYDGSARLADMDADGVDAEIVFPPQRTIGHFLGDPDDAFVRAGIDAYNEFLWEEFCAPDRSRLVGAAQLPSTGTSDAVDALQRAVDRGFHTVVLSNWPSGEEQVGDQDEAFWSAAAEAGVPVCIHINVVSRAARQRARKAAAAAGGRTLYGGKAGAGARAAAGLSGVFSMVPAVIGTLIFTGVFERHPGLHVAMIETGVGWLPHFLEQMDDRYWRNRSWTELPIDEPPSSYWHSNMSASFIRDDNGIRNRHEVGVANMMWSTDYPHHGNDWPYSRKVIAETMADLPADERDLIVAGNAVRIFALDI